MEFSKNECFIFDSFRYCIGRELDFLYQSYDYTTIANATLGYYFAPVLVMILSPFILREQLSIKKWFVLV